MNPDLLQAKRQNALAAVERLLRVTRTHESGAWVQHYEGIQGALEGGRDWDAIAREQRLGAPTARWAIAERLATDVYMAVKGLRFYIVYQVDEPLVPVGGDDPQIVERLPEQLLEYITAVVDGREPVTGWVRWLRGHWEELESIVEKQWPMEKYFTTLRGLSKYLARQGVPHRRFVPPSDTGPDATEHAIFAAVLEHDQAQGSVVEGQAITWDCLGTITGLFPTLLHDETIEDFLTKSSASYALDKAAMAELGYPLGIGNANQKTSLARAGLSSAASQALIYKRMVHNWFSGGWTAEGIFFLLESRAGRWSVQKQECVWTAMT